MTRSYGIGLFFGVLLAGLAGVVEAQSSTTLAGAGAPFNNLQDSLALNYQIVTNGVYPSPGGSQPLVMGMLRMTAAVPNRGQLADGTVISIPDNESLFSIVGTTYGGDGSDHFALPNLAGRTVVGAGEGNGLSYWAVGAERGDAETFVFEANMPWHTHEIFDQDSNVIGETNPSGRNLPISNLQPSLGVNYIIAVDGIFPGENLSAAPAMLGQVVPYAGQQIPGGWLQADGRLLSIQQNQALFAVIGNTFGGNGVETFALPDLRGRTIVGTGAGDHGDVHTGDNFGTEAIQLNWNQMPVHQHQILQPDGTVEFTSFAGQSSPIDNRQPSLGLNYLVVTNGVFPVPGYDQQYDEFEYGEIVAMAGNVLPANMMRAEGQLLPISQYSALFALLGNVYGGDGVTTFALPDLRGRTIVGAGEGFDAGTVQSALRTFAAAGPLSQDCDCTCPTYQPGDTPGNSDPRLTLNNLPSHGHEVPEPASWALLALASLGLIGAARRGR